MKTWSPRPESLVMVRGIVAGTAAAGSGWVTTSAVAAMASTPNAAIAFTSLRSLGLRVRDRVRDMGQISSVPVVPRCTYGTVSNKPDISEDC